MQTWHRVAIGTAAVGAGFAVAYVICRPRPVVLPPLPGPRPRPEIDLEDWEAEAAGGDDVAFGEDDGDVEVQPPGVQVGGGSPAELCHTVAQKNPPPPAEVCVLDPLAHPEFRPVVGAAPLGERGTTGAEWPVVTKHRRRLVTSYRTSEGIRGAWGREFGAKRTSDGKVRRHVGVDLFASESDVVVAPEKGRVVAILPFKDGTWALYLRLPDDRVVNLGEIEKLSWREFGIKPGMDVEKGQALVRIGKMGTKSMLHIEMFDGKDIDDEALKEEIRGGEMRWLSEAPPPRVIDPSAYLVDAAARTYRQEQGIT